MHRHYLMFTVILLAFVSMAPTFVFAAEGPVRPARIAMFHDGGSSHDSGQMRRAAEFYEGLAVVDEYAPGAGNPSFGPEVDLGSYDLVFIDAADGAPLGEEALAKLRGSTRFVVVNPEGAAQGNVSLEEHSAIADYWNNRSVENDRALVAYLTREVIGRSYEGDVPQPVIYPRIGFYHAGVPRLLESS